MLARPILRGRDADPGLLAGRRGCAAGCLPAFESRASQDHGESLPAWQTCLQDGVTDQFILDPGHLVMYGRSGSVEALQCVANSVQLVSYADGRNRVDHVDTRSHGTRTSFIDDPTSFITLSRRFCLCIVHRRSPYARVRPVDSEAALWARNA